MKAIKRSMKALALASAMVMGTALAGVAGNIPNVVTSSPIKGKIIKGPHLKFCPDLRVWSNYNLGPKGEFPYETGCKNCWLKVGVLNMVDMSLWVENGGTMNMPATAARMTWQSGKPPYQQRSVIVTIPALKPGERKLITINVPRNEFFQVAKPIKLEMDYRNTVRECNENNNISTYQFH